MLDEGRFINCSRIFDGNVAEPTTLVAMINDIDSQASGEDPPLLISQPTIIMDAGIASEENLRMVKESGFSHIVVSSGRTEPMEEDSFDELQPEIKVKEMRVSDETYLHCISDGKMKKEQAIITKAREAMEKELASLREGLFLKRCLKSYPKVLERIGRLRQRYRRVSKGFFIDAKEHEENAAAITWRFDPSHLGKPHSGSYCIRTDRTDLLNREIWSLYIILTSLKDAFRSLKGELGLLPIHHRKAERIEGHLFISILAYLFSNA